MRASTEKCRYTAAFFYNPSYDALVAPYTLQHEKPLYRPISWGEFRSLRFQGDYADVGKEIQIENYRIYSSNEL